MNSFTSVNKLHIFVIISILSLTLFPGPSQAQVKFAVSIPDDMINEPVDGRLLIFIAKYDNKEPRFQLSDGPGTQLVFGMNVDAMPAGEITLLDHTAFGYPLRSVREIPDGQYYAQALLHRYETFTRADGHRVKLPMDRGEGQVWNKAPGNLYSTPQKILIEQEKDQTIRVELNRIIPEIEPPEETRYIKHIRIKSKSSR